MRRWRVALGLAAVALPAVLAAVPARAATAPPAPDFTTPAYGATVSTTTPRLAGTGQPGDTIIVTEMGVVACTATVTVARTWSCVPSSPLLNGPHLLQARETDQQGQASAGSETVRIVVKVAGEPTPPKVVTTPARSTAPVGPAAAPSSGTDWVVPLAVLAIVAVAIVVCAALWRRMRPHRR